MTPDPVLVWILAAALFLGGISYVNDRPVPQLLALFIAAAVVVPLLVVLHRSLAAWLLAAVLGLVIPYALSLDEGLPWMPTQAVVSLIVLYVVGSRRPWPTVVAVWAVTVGGAGAFGSPDTPAAVTFVTLTLLFGYLVGTRRVLQTEVIEGERRREDEETRRAILEERTRIARELHDVVAHHMSMIAVQAETAPFRIADLSERGKENVAEIASTAREALTEMRRLLDVLRNEEAVPDHAPQPDLDKLDHLLDGARRAGLEVRWQVDGDREMLSPGLELSAYRIIQEALSNAVRHAPGAPVQVRVRYERQTLRLMIRNDRSLDGPADPQSSSSGHGLLGMRERAAMLGGTLTAGPTGDGGYVVEAALPIPQRDGSS